MGEKFTTQSAAKVAAGGFQVNARSHCSGKLNLTNKGKMFTVNNPVNNERKLHTKNSFWRRDNGRRGVRYPLFAFVKNQ